MCYQNNVRSDFNRSCRFLILAIGLLFYSKSDAVTLEFGASTLGYMYSATAGGAALSYIGGSGCGAVALPSFSATLSEEKRFDVSLSAPIGREFVVRSVPSSIGLTMFIGQGQTRWIADGWNGGLVNAMPTVSELKNFRGPIPYADTTLVQVDQEGRAIYMEGGKWWSGAPKLRFSGLNITADLSRVANEAFSTGTFVPQNLTEGCIGFQSTLNFAENPGQFIVYGDAQPTPGLFNVNPIAEGSVHSGEIGLVRNSPARAEIRDPVTGEWLSTVALLEDSYVAVAGQSLPDSDGNGFSEIAVLAARRNDSRGLVEIRDIDEGAVPRTIWFAAGHTPVGFAMVDDDYDGNGIREVAVLLTRNSDGRGIVEVKSIYGPTNPRTIWLGAGLTPIKLVVLPDSDGNGIPEVAVLSKRKSDGRIVVEIRNVFGAALPNSLWFMSGNKALDLAVVGDKDGNGVSEVAVLSQRLSDGRLVTEIKNARGATNPSAVWFAAGHQGIALEGLEDADGNGVPEIAVLSYRKSDGRVLVEVKNAVGSTNPRYLWFPAGYHPVSLSIVNDFDDDGIDEVGVLLVRGSDDRLLLQARNTAGPQAPKNIWFFP